MQFPNFLEATDPVLIHMWSAPFHVSPLTDSENHGVDVVLNFRDFESFTNFPL